MAAVLAAIFLVVLDGAIANVALPTIAVQLQISPAQSIWVVMGYQVAVVMALLPCAALGESIGFRRVFSAGVVVFAGASAVCALSPTASWLIAGRFLQGLGGAAIMSIGVGLLRFIYPHHMLGKAIGWNALSVALSAAAGPTLGAAILSLAGWPWLFAINIPVGAFVLLASRALPPVRGTARRLDPVSILLNAAFFGLLVLGADRIIARPDIGAGLLAASAMSLIALVRRELPREVPLVPFDLLGSPSFRVSVIASVLCFAGQTLSIVALPFYLQHSFGLTPLATGLAITPWPLAVAVAAPISARLADRVPTARLCATGGLCLSAGLGLAAWWPVGAGLLPLVLFMIACGFGFGLFQTPNNRNMLLSVPRARSGAAGGMQGTARLLGQTLGALLMGIIFTLVAPDAAPRYGLGVGAALALAAGLSSLLRGSRAATFTQVSPASP